MGYSEKGNRGFKTRIGTIVATYRTKCFSGQRDIGGSIVTNSGRVVLAVGASDCWEGIHFKIAVSDDGGKSFREKFVMPPVYDVTYQTAGMLYDSKNDILMALFGETKGYKLFNKRNDYLSGVRKFSPENFGHSKLMMARSIDNGERWKLFTLYDYKKNNREHIMCIGVGGCGVQTGDDIFVPQILSSANKAQNAERIDVPLSRIRNLNRENTSNSFEFENEFRMLATNADDEIRYADETVYIRKLDRTGYLSFHRPNTSGKGMPFRREYDNEHRPVSDVTRVQSRGFDTRDYEAGMHGPLVTALNVTRMIDGNLMMSARFYGTEHHKGGNIFLTSRDEGLTWDFEDDEIPYSLDPFRLVPTGGGNPSMSYMPDASLIHTTSANTKEPLMANGGTLVCRFRGFIIKIEKSSPSKGKVVIDTSDLLGIDPVYIGNVSVTNKKSIKFENCNSDIFALTNYSPDRRVLKIDYKITGSSPSITLKITLANKVNSYRPVFEPVIKINR